MRLERQSGDTSWKIPVPGLDRKPDKLPSTRLIRSGLQKAWPSQARLGRETVKRQRQEVERGLCFQVTAQNVVLLRTHEFKLLWSWPAGLTQFGGEQR